MRILAVIAGAISLLSWAGCTGETSTPPGRIVSVLREIGTAALRRDAEAVARRVTIREIDGPTKIPEQLWTDSIRRFGPEYIYWGSDSLTIVTSSSGRYENGIVVYFPSRPDDLLAPGDFAGGGSGRSDYKVEAGVYWFWQKIRFDAALRRKVQKLETTTNGPPNKAASLERRDGASVSADALWRGVGEPRRSANHVFFALAIPDLCVPLCPLWFDRGIMTTTEDTESTEGRVPAPQSSRRPWPNQAASGNGAVASRFHAAALSRAVPALRRSPKA
jgi:hypothetical protein